jgi:hypothetical protein
LTESQFELQVPGETAEEKYENLSLEYMKLSQDFIEIQGMLALVLMECGGHVDISRKTAEEAAFDDGTQFVTEPVDDGNALRVRLVNG